MTDEPILSVGGSEETLSLRKGIFNRQVGAAKAVDGGSASTSRPARRWGWSASPAAGSQPPRVPSSAWRSRLPARSCSTETAGGGATRNPDGTHPNDVTKFSDAELKRFRRGAQMIFQDPASSFDPRMTVGSAVAEMLEIHGMSDRHRRRAIVEDLLERVGLSAVDYDRYPHEFSGGQKQRIALARALVLNPDLIIADEPVSALDVSIQAEILSLIDDLQAEFDLSMLFISHDMSVIRRICDRVAVMYLGEIVEVGPTDDGSSPTRNTPTPRRCCRRSRRRIRGRASAGSNSPARYRARRIRRAAAGSTRGVTASSSRRGSTSTSPTGAGY